MRTTVDVDDALLAQAKVVAARTHRTLSAVVNDALRVSLRTGAGEAGSKRAVELPVSGSGGLQLGVHLENREAIGEILGDNDRPGEPRAAP